MLKQINSLDEYLLKQTTFCSSNEQALSCLFRAVLEPVLECDNCLESDVVFKVNNRNLFTGLITRLEFSEIHFVDYGRDDEGKENLDDTDFLLVATSDFISFLAWKQEDCNIKYYCITNSNEIETIITILDNNANIDLGYLKDKYKFSKFKNNLTSLCINKLANMLENSKVENSNIDDNINLAEKIEHISKKARYVSHEIKNQLSICDLYLEILKRYCEKNDIDDQTILKSVSCIDKSIKIAANNLIQFKSLNSKELKLYKTSFLIDSATELAYAYLENKNIKLIIENSVHEEIFVDQNLFISVIINLIKNASEAFDDFEKDGNWIKISTSINNDSVEIQVSNNAKPISNPDIIFEEGVTTKTTGSGLGLFICKKTIEDLCGQICLIKSDEDSTIFQIKFCL